jgi:Holliday junction DNA helicase RuvA
MIDYIKEGYTVISYVKGTLVEKEEDVIVVEAGDIGYNIHVPLSFLEELPPIGEEVRVYTYLQVKEDAMTLFGFGSRQDLKMFKQLLGVNGIGPKGALGVLSAMSPDDLRLAIISGDAKAISRAPGIGVKTAQRVILDLKDRISMEDVFAKPEAQEGTAPARNGGMKDAGKEAVDALVALGYSAMEATKAVRQVEVTDTMTAEDVLKASLKYLAF